MTAVAIRRTSGCVRVLLQALTLAAVAAAPARAEGENWVPLYNKLAVMLDQRCQAVNLSFNRRIGACATVTGADLNAMRACIIDLATNYYIDGEFICDDTNGASDIPPLIKETDAYDGNGNKILVTPNLFTKAGLANPNAFTMMPADYGASKYKNNFGNDTPVLWEHFKEIYSTLLVLKTAKYKGQWKCLDVLNGGSGTLSSYNIQWDTAYLMAISYSQTANYPFNDTPTVVYAGSYISTPYNSFNVDLFRLRAFYEFSVPILSFSSTSLPVKSYIVASSYGRDDDIWDANGDNVIKDRWSRWCSSFTFTKRDGKTCWRTKTCLSSSLDFPNECPNPLGARYNWIRQGWITVNDAATLEWNFPAFSSIVPTAVPPPFAPVIDDRNDGLINVCASCITGCVLTLPADPRNPFDGIEIKNRFGTSDATVGLQVSAYVAAMTGPQPAVSASLGSALPCGQKFAYSLDTRILSDSVVDGHRYVNLLRPRGRIITFHFPSDTATTGTPVGVDKSQDYYLVRSKDGASHYLVFNDGGKSGQNSIHYYYWGGLAGVGRGPSPTATDTLWGTIPWAGLEPVYESMADPHCQRLAKITTAQQGNVLIYDRSGRYLIAQTFELDADPISDPSPAVSFTQSRYAYVSVIYPPPDVSLAQSRYAYDAAGRLVRADTFVQGSLSSGVQVTYTDTANKATYVHYGHDGVCAPAKVKVTTLTQATSTDGVRTVTTYIGDRDKDAQGAIIASVSSVSWRSFPWGEEKVAETGYDPANPGPADAPTIYSYYTDAENDSDNYGRLKLVVNPDQFWARYTYDARGRTLTETTPFLNAAPNAADGNYKVVAYSYTPAFGSGDDGTRSLNAPRLTVTTLCGREVARTWLVEQAGCTRDIRCAAAGAAWDAAGNQVTVTERFTSGVWQGRTSRIVRPDGTITIYGYAMDNGELVTTVSTGAPATDGQSVVDGVRSVTRSDAAGRELSSATYDIASNLFLASRIQSDFDEFGRVTQTDYSDGTRSETIYGCCGPDTVTGRDGIVTSYVYDDLQQVVSETRDGITTGYAYDAAGHVIATTRAGILQNSSTYDSAGRLTISADALGHTTTYAETLNHDGNGNLDGTRTKTTTNPDGTTQIETFNCDGSPATVTGTAVHPLKYKYGVDTDNGPYTKTIRVGANNAETEWTTSYTDFLGRGYKTEAPGGAVSQSFYNALGQQVKAVDPDGVTTLYAYNAKGEQEYAAIAMNNNDEIDFAGSDRITRTQSAVLTARGTTVRRTTSSVWTASGETVQAVRDASADGHRQWDTRFDQTTATEEVIVPATATRTVTVTRPDRTRLVSVTQNGRALSETQYDSASNVVAGQTRTYDAHGRVATETDSRGLVTSYGYDNADRTTSVTRANGGLSQTTEYEYDTMGRIITTTLPDGEKLCQTYWPDGQPRRKSGVREYPSETAYDTQGRRVTLTTWQDFTGNAGAAVTTWVYDANTGLLAQKLYPDGKGPSYTYTLAGRLLSRKWARDTNATTYSHNNAGDLVLINYPDTSTIDVAYAYDRQGRQTSVTDAAGTRTITYTAAGQPDILKYVGGPLDGIVLDYAQDALTRPAGYTATMGTQTVAAASYDYDTAGRLGTVTAGDDTFAYSYIQSSGSLVGGITARHNNNPVMTTTKNYDGLNRLTAISQQVGGSTVSSHAYAYNQADQRTRATREDGAYWDYAYDALGQVVSGIKKTADNQAIPGMTFGYSYDDIGNRKTSSTTTDRESHVSAYTANLLNQYTQRTVPGYFEILGSANPAAKVSVTSPADSTLPSSVHATTRLDAWWYAAIPVSNTSSNGSAAVQQSLKVTGVLKNQGAGGKDIVSEQTGSLFVPHSPEAFTYDADGNLLSDGRWAYAWDAENRLAAMETKSGIGVSPMLRLVFAYDAQARRISKKVFAKSADLWALQSETRFLYDGWNLIAEFAIDPLTQARTLKTAYAWGLDLSGSPQGAGGVGGLLASTTAAGPANYFCYDGNGNVTALADASAGTLSATYEYDPFGNILAQSGIMATGNLFRFSTKNIDHETTLYYYGFRYYYSSLGLWNSRDSIEERGSIGLYQFAQNNPISVIDILGNWGRDIHLGGTQKWATMIGYPIKAADDIAEADNDVDSFYSGKSYFPSIIFGDQSYHFNRPWGGRDSRYAHYLERYKNAMSKCSDTTRTDKPEEAAVELGVGLHPLQDYYAHGDYGRTDTGGDLYIVHNQYAPEATRLSGYPGSLSNYPDNAELDAVNSSTGRPDQRDRAKGDDGASFWGNYEWYWFTPGHRRITATVMQTENALNSYRRYLKNNAKTCCECQKYFGVSK